jgi:hypothetical protein
VAVADQKGVGAGEAVGGAGEGEVGGAAAGETVRRVVGDFCQHGGDVAQVAAEDFAEQGVDVAKVAFQRAGSDAQFAAEGDECHVLPPLAGEDRSRQFGDALPSLFDFRRHEVVVGEVFVDVGAEHSGWDEHACVLE